MQAPLPPASEVVILKQKMRNELLKMMGVKLHNTSYRV